MAVTGYTVFRFHRVVELHFTTDHYDLFKHKGRVNGGTVDDFMNHHQWEKDEDIKEACKDIIRIIKKLERLVKYDSKKNQRGLGRVYKECGSG